MPCYTSINIRQESRLIMKRSFLHLLITSLIASAAVLSCVGSTPVAVAQPIVDAEIWKTSITAADLDPAAYVQWTDGVETPFIDRGWENPAALLWTQTSSSNNYRVTFGDSKKVGVRYLRLGWKTPQLVGSVLVSGGGTLSVLKENAPYPGKLNDDTQWIPAQRLLNGKITTSEVGSDTLGLWILPPNTRTRALRFAHTPDPTDSVYGGGLGGVYVLSDRVSNIAPQAVVSASTMEQIALLTNNNADGWGAWENISQENKPLQRATAVSSQQPEWVTLTWPQAVKLRGVNLLWTGFTTAQVQVYEGPADRHPNKSTDSDWKTVATPDKLDMQYPRSLAPNWIDFGQEYSARALRVRITRGFDDNFHDHMRGKGREFRRVFLGEVQALQLLGTAPLQAVAEPKAAAQSNPPIPIRFTLQKAGYVTLVIEGMSGKRIRNLVSETYFPSGNNVAWWDGTDDLGRDIDAAAHGLYRIPAQFVQPGAYRVRGLVRDAIDLRYEFGVYSAGQPAWATTDRSGAWLSNHTPPQAALYIPAENSPSGKAAVLLGSPVSEGRDGLAWVGLDGRKQGGKTWVGGTWTGSAYLARDAGAEALPQIYAYSLVAWEGELRLISLNTNGQDLPVLKAPWKYPGATDEERKANSVTGGIAAYSGVLAISLPKQNQILFIDAKKGEVISTREIADPRGVAFDATGRVLTLSGKTLLRFDRNANDAPQTIVSTNLEDPRGLALDNAGQILISDGGKSHQVKLFDASGKFVRAIGKAGAPQAGAYDPLHMNNPDGITIDSSNRLWVAENDYLPRRVSVWSLDGKFVNAFYGPSEYGGGGRLDPTDKTRFYYGGMEFKLDWVKGKDTLVNVLYRPQPTDMPLAVRTAAPEMPLYHAGRRYFANDFNGNPVGGQPVVYLFSEKNGVARPVAAMGRAFDWDLLKTDAFKADWPANADLKGDYWGNNGKNQAFFIWNDLNADAQAQPKEVSWQQGTSGGITVMPDLSFVVARLNGKAMRFAPTFAANGAPRYDLAKGEVLVEGVQDPQSSGGDQVLTGENGLTIATLGIKPFHTHSISGSKNGVPLWSYPNPWPGLHASHEAAKPDRPGQVIGATRLLGNFIKPKGEAGQIWGVNANMGNMYLFTADGLFIATLFEDVRQGKLWQMPVGTRNMKLEGISLHDENFWPSLTQTPDGQVYVVDGANSVLVRVDGLESIKRLPDATIRVGPEDLQKAQTWQINVEVERQKRLGNGVLAVANRAAAPVVDGKIEEWAGSSWVDIDKSGIGANFNSNSKPYEITGAVSISGDRLYAAWHTANADLLRNSGENLTALFKTGGTLDLMIGTNAAADPKRSTPVAGDVRLLITKVKDKTFALLYRAVVPGTKTPVAFSSPWRTIKLDVVQDVSDQVQLAGADGNYEISIPLAALGLNPQSGQTIKGDIGVLRGDGTQTLSRTYWSNKATGITADVPSEAELTPKLWGDWKFE